MAADVSPVSEDELGPISAINVTPFVDVVLVLLVIFMVTAPMILKDTMNIKLPAAASVDTKAVQSLGIVVTKQGQFLLNGQLADTDAITQAAREAARTNPEAQVIIAADIDARHGDVVRAIDLIKSAGLERFAIQIERQ